MHLAPALIASLVFSCSLRAGQTDPGVLLRTGRNQEALAAIQSLLQLHPRDARLLTMQGIARSAMGDEQAALESYRGALAASPNYLAALEGAAQIEYKENDSQAVGHIDRLLKINPSDETAHAMRASLEFRSGVCAAALEDFSSALSVIESQPDAMRQYGSCLFRLERWKDSEQTFSKILMASPNDVRAAYGVAAAQIEQGEFEGAVTTLKPFPNDSDALALSSHALEKLNRIPEAVANLRSAILAEPGRESFYTQFAELCFSYKSYQAGIDMLGAGLIKLPQSFRLYVARGVLLVQQGNYDLADSDFAKAEELDPRDSVGADATVLALVQANRLDEARKMLDEKLKQHPSDPQLHFFLADVCSRQGDFKTSLVAARKAVYLRPDYVLAHDLLGRLYLQAGDTAKAVAESEAALQADPQDETALYRWLRILKANHSKVNESAVADLTARWTKARQRQKDEEQRESQYRIVSQQQR